MNSDISLNASQSISILIKVPDILPRRIQQEAIPQSSS